MDEEDFNIRNVIGTEFEKYLLNTYDVLRNEHYVDILGFNHPELKYSGINSAKWRELYPDLWYISRDIFIECKWSGFDTMFKLKTNDMHHYKIFRDAYDKEVWLAFDMNGNKRFIKYTDEFITYVKGHRLISDKKALKNKKYKSPYYILNVTAYPDFKTEADIFTQEVDID